MGFSPLQMTIERYWIWALVGIEAAIIVFGVFLWVFPEYERLNMYKSDELTSRALEVEQMTQRANQLRALLAAYQTIDQSRVQLVTAFLPREINFSHLLFTIARTAERAGFSVDAFSIQETPAVQGGEFPEQKQALVQVSLVGKGYTQWKDFLRLAERQLPLFDLVAAGFRPQSNRQQLTLRTYSTP